ncbi:hypothetical protein MMC13_008526 [Lambiella insularis]|nr:hypothetical protein [Lambiella insularis]
MVPYALTLRTLPRPVRTALPRFSILLNRSFTNTTHTSYPRADAQDKDSMNTEANEYAKSGTDDDAARQESAAFDPDKTNPEEQKHIAGEGKSEYYMADRQGQNTTILAYTSIYQDNQSNPLEVSPANPDVSKQRPGQEKGAESSPGSHGESRERSSGGGSPAKGKKTS